jgi:hypothetical protein
MDGIKEYKPELRVAGYKLRVTGLETESLSLKTHNTNYR